MNSSKLSYRIEVNRSAAKALKKIPKGDRKRIIDKIDSLSENLPNPDTTKMKGNNPFHKVRRKKHWLMSKVKWVIMALPNRYFFERALFLPAQ